MGKNSAIEWTHHTFNPWIGCTKVSAGCANCYAERDMDHRLHRVQWGPAGTRSLTSPDYWKQPLRWNREAQAAGERRRVFCASLADIFEDRPELAQPRMQLFSLIFRTPHLDWLLLTKRPDVAAVWLSRQNTPGLVQAYACMDAKPGDVEQCAEWFLDHPMEWPLPNVWLGTSVENQATADERIPHLLAAPARIRFLSAEPLLGPVNLRGVNTRAGSLDSLWGETSSFKTGCIVKEGPGIDWAIAGGESGPNARPMHPDWARLLRDQCAKAGVPFHFKQWGSHGANAVFMGSGEPSFREFASFEHWCNKATGWIAPGDVCVDLTGRVLKIGKDFQEASYPVAVMRPMDKKAAGRLLDGRTHDEFPELAAQ